MGEVNVTADNNTLLPSPTASLLVDAVTEIPTSNPAAVGAFPPDANPLSVSAERDPNNSNNNDSTTLSMGAIIGIATGCGLLLILLLCGIIFFIRKRKENNSEDDGIDTDWQQSSTDAEDKVNTDQGTGSNTGAIFQYGNDEGTQEGGLKW